MNTKASNKDSHDIQASIPIASSLQCLPMYQMKTFLGKFSELSSDTNKNNSITIKHRDKVKDEPRALRVCII
jgi:hypothetical protein